MNVDFRFENLNKKTVGVAVSGGKDSMALLFFLNENLNKFNFKLIALNIEHGIRGEESLKDSQFVKDYCFKNNIKLYCYSVDSIGYSKLNKLSIEESARVLRYNCFFKAISNKLCDYVAVAHHALDNAETVLFNLFRGAGLKGVSGIKQISDKIIRPFLYTPKTEIDEYIKEHNIPYVEDSTNNCTDYTRNYIRKKIFPLVTKVFPEAEKSISRFCKISILEDEFLDELSENYLIKETDKVKIKLPINKALFGRAFLKSLKYLGVKKNWEYIHIEQAFNLLNNENGKKINLPENIIAIKEYDFLAIKKLKKIEKLNKKFEICNFEFNGKIYSITLCSEIKNLNEGLFADLNKIPNGSVIRTRKAGDVFTNFGGKTKLLSDYFIDKKINQTDRDTIPLIAYENKIFAIFGFAISENVKIDKSTKNIIKFN